jgi:hypothetical protein
MARLPAVFYGQYFNINDVKFRSKYERVFQQNTTVAVHQYYCAKDAGFWVYKTLGQWKAENPGVMETLVSNKARPPVQTSYGPAAILNQRFIYFFEI